MGARHVDGLLSAAYDNALSDTERRGFDDHLARCAECAAKAADFRRAIDAVRGLPAARMPVRVVLPATPPVAEPVGRWRGLLRVPRLGPAWGAAAMAAVGVAVVVLVVRGHGGGGTTPTSSLSLSQDQGVAPMYAGGAHANAGPGGGRQADTAAARCPLPILVTKASATVTSGGGPAGFANRVSVRTPQRPGQELVLATTGNHYAPGSQVLVFAALTTGPGSSSGNRAVVPCVSLEPQQMVALIPDQQGSGGSAAQNGSPPAASGSASPQPVPVNSSPNGAPAQGYGSFQSTALSPQLGSVLTPEQIQSFAPYLLERPLALAEPTGQTIGGTLPVQVLTIPASVPKGTVLRLVALVPAGSPGQLDSPAVEAVITLVVS